MAANLIAAGHELRINRPTAATKGLLDQGAVGAESAAEAAADVDVLIVMVPDTPDVEGVLFGADGVVESLRPGSLIIDMSSISPVSTQAFAHRVQARGIGYLDAPVSGGEVGAREGTLSIMVGGSDANFERARPLFEAMGKNISHVGGVGAGQTAKVANQIIVGVTIEAVAEALLFAERAGADPAKVRAALMGGFASSRVLEVHGQRMIDGTFDPGFRIRLHRKDLSLAIDSARALDIALPATAATQQIMNAAIGAGLGDRDHSALRRAIDPSDGGER